MGGGGKVPFTSPLLDFKVGGAMVTMVGATDCDAFGSTATVEATGASIAGWTGGIWGGARTGAVAP